MTHSTGILNTQEPQKETDNKNSFKIEDIANSPFTKVSGGEEVFVALGQYRLTDETISRKEVDKLEAMIKKTDWRFLCAVIGAITKQTVDTYKGEL